MGTGIKKLSWATLVVTYLLVVAGGVVRVTGSGLGCGETGHDWPVCRGGLVPPPDLPTLIEFNHRMFATASTILIVLLCVAAWLRYRNNRKLVRAATLAVALLIVQILLGGLTVELKLQGSIVAVHMANAMLLLGTLVYVTVHVHSAENTQSAVKANGLLIAAPVAAYILVLSGSLVVANSAGTFCTGWPLCGNGFDLPVAGLAALNFAHRIVAGIVVLFLGYAMAKIRKAYPGTVAAKIAIALLIVLVVQVLVGAAAVETHMATALRGSHIAIAALVWALTLAVSLAARKLPASTQSSTAKPAAMPAAPFGVGAS